MYGEDDRRFVEPPPIGNYRAMELSPKLPTNGAQGTYPSITFWKDRAIVRFTCGLPTPRTVDTPKAVGRESTEPGWLGGDTCISLPISWFYEDLCRFG